MVGLTELYTQGSADDRLCAQTCVHLLRTGTVLFKGCNNKTKKIYVAETKGGSRGPMCSLSGPLQRKLLALPLSSSMILALAGEAKSAGVCHSRAQVFQALKGGAGFGSSLFPCHAGFGSVLGRDFCHIIPHPKDRGAVATNVSIPASRAGPGEVPTGPRVR